MKKNLNIQEEWNQLGAAFSLHIGMPHFSIPEAYFDNLPTEIIEGIMSVNVAEPKLAMIETPYQVPENYFGQLPIQITTSINHIETVMQQGFSNIEKNNNVFEVPQSYFENLTDKILNKIHSEIAIEEELLESPLLASLKTSNPFELPAALKINLPSIASESNEDKSSWNVPMVVNKRLRMSNIAVAASVALFFVLGATWLHLGKNETINTNNMAMHTLVSPQDKAEKLLAEIPDGAIEEYLNQNIEQFNEFALETNVVGHKTNSIQTIKHELDKISNEEIQAYLNGGI
ncbi:MAG TPA: hypothetical protein PKX92_05280 [Edaphocola sp.]|nr:hypothetical protein [Edaphocola sp.]